MKWLAHIAEVTVLVSKLGVRLSISSLPGCSEPWVWRGSGSGVAQAEGRDMDGVRRVAISGPY